MTQKSLQDLIADGSVKVESAESPEDAKHRRRKDLLLSLAAIFIAIVFLFGVGGFSGYFLITGQGSAEERMCAASVLTSIATGAVGFAFGKNT